MIIIKTKKFQKICYVVKYPDNFAENEKYPLIVFLHGAGGRGKDISCVKSNPFFTETEKFKFKAVVFAPQCYTDSWFDIFEQLGDFIDFAVEQPYIDKERVYLIGASMGGYATWQMAMTKPEVFAAVVPICGGGMYWNAARLKNMGVWAFHGSEDQVVFCEESKKMVDAINRADGRQAKLTICDGVGHYSWRNAYNCRELFDWLFAQKRSGREIEESRYNNSEQFG